MFLNECGCRYSYESIYSLPRKPLYFNERYLDVKKVLMDTFFGSSKEGVYSPSVQSTLYQMAKAVLGRCPSSLCLLYLFIFSRGNILRLILDFYDRFHDISMVRVKMPNLHFLPVNLTNRVKDAIVKVGLLSDNVFQKQNPKSFENEESFATYIYLHKWINQRWWICWIFAVWRWCVFTDRRTSWINWSKLESFLVKDVKASARSDFCPKLFPAHTLVIFKNNERTYMYHHSCIHVDVKLKLLLFYCIVFVDFLSNSKCWTLKLTTSTSWPWHKLFIPCIFVMWYPLKPRSSSILEVKCIDSIISCYFFFNIFLAVHWTFVETVYILAHEMMDMISILLPS